MAKVVGIQFQRNGKVYYFEAGTLEPHPGDYVIVDTERGNDLAEVVLDLFEFAPEADGAPLKKVIRMATEHDILCASENRKKEKEAFSICQRKIQEHKLEMKLVSVEYSFDGSKVLFYFTANGRVDFRSLVKDLASVFKTRIELRQIGVRDEARMLGGLGPCGRPICCKAFLNDFQPVSIKMAKEQNLSLNPTKISGVCGRLMCCLKYEQDQYEQVRKRMPRIGREVMTPDGAGTVTELNIVKETVSVRITNGDSSEIKSYPMDAISRPAGDQRTTAAPRQPAEEPETEEPEGTDETAAEILETEMEEEAAAAAEPPREKPRQPRAKSGGKAEGERSPKPERKLGQPVKRENPKKAAQEGAAEPKREKARRQESETNEKAAPAEQPKKTSAPAAEQAKKPADPAQAPASKAPASAEGRTKQSAKKKSNWADQVQKAMEAIGQEQQ